MSDYLEEHLCAIAGDKVAVHGYYLLVADDENAWGDDQCKVTTYEGNDYCGPCIDALIAFLKRRNPKLDEDHFMAAGSWWGESDTVPLCAWCGQMLIYSLTDEGVGEEQAHYLEYPPDIPIRTGDAYAIDQALVAGADQGFRERATEWVRRHIAAIVYAEEAGIDAETEDMRRIFADARKVVRPAVKRTLEAEWQQMPDVLFRAIGTEGEDP